MDVLKFRSRLAFIMLVGLQRYYCVFVLVMSNFVIQKDSKANELLPIFYENNDIPRLTNSRINELIAITSNRATDLAEIYAIWVYRNNDYGVWLDVLYTPVNLGATLFEGKSSVIRNRRRSEKPVEQGYLYEAGYRRYWIIADKVSLESRGKHHPLVLYEIQEESHSSWLDNSRAYIANKSAVEIKDIIMAYDIVKELMDRAKNDSAENIYPNINVCSQGSSLGKEKLELMLRERNLQMWSEINSRFYDAHILTIEIVSPKAMKIRIGYTGFNYGKITFRLSKQNNNWIVDKMPEWWGVPYQKSGGLGVNQ